MSDTTFSKYTRPSARQATLKTVLESGYLSTPLHKQVSGLMSHRMSQLQAHSSFGNDS